MKTKTVMESWQVTVQEKSEQEKTKSEENSSHQFVHRLMKQGKQLSQLVAKSWMEDDVALKLREYFIHPENQDAPDGHLKKLLGNKGDGEIGELLLQIFQDYELPIFNEYELAEVYSFCVSKESTEGSINDIAQPRKEQRGPYFQVVIPYPQRPQLGEATITIEQLQEWVNQDVTDSEGNLLIDEDHQIHPPSPYIPPTCC